MTVKTAYGYYFKGGAFVASLCPQWVEDAMVKASSRFAEKVVQRITGHPIPGLAEENARLTKAALADAQNIAHLPAAEIWDAMLALYRRMGLPV